MKPIIIRQMNGGDKRWAVTVGNQFTEYFPSENAATCYANSDDIQLGGPAERERLNRLCQQTGWRWQATLSQNMRVAMRHNHADYGFEDYRAAADFLCGVLAAKENGADTCTNLDLREDVRRLEGHYARARLLLKAFAKMMAPSPSGGLDRETLDLARAGLGLMQVEMASVSFTFQDKQD